MPLLQAHLQAGQRARWGLVRGAWAEGGDLALEGPEVVAAERELPQVLGAEERGQDAALQEVLENVRGGAAPALVSRRIAARLVDGRQGGAGQEVVAAGDAAQRAWRRLCVWGGG
jgi:hypothetical protein